MSSIRIDRVQPQAALPGGEFTIRGTNLSGEQRPEVLFGDAPGSIVVGSGHLVIAKVPDAPSYGELTVRHEGATSNAYHCAIGIQLADSLHPVANPVADAEGNIYTTFSGTRGQKTAVSVYKIDLNYDCRPFVSDIINATGLAFDAEGLLYVSSRNEGTIHQITPSGNMSTFVEGMGIATGLAFDPAGNLYVGDRSGTIFKIGPDREVFVFATLEPSIAAYHLAFGPDSYLYVTGPTTSSFDSIQRIAPNGETELFFRGLGRPQGITFDHDGNLYCAASFAGHRGVVRIDPQREASHFLSGHNIVGLCFLPSRSLAVATNNAIYRVDVDIAGA
ncbi:SMP-30/gluconolactonase/LRE family protein [Bryobacter aggregatus]|uniref:SMP-30/gluconolactonase/LRE family protein n=1 Tax=Bryobacter aggregatus TaxID=360054 RepID=UPI0004E20D89|nr:IPT/TIG domain-containing protein [Bryobacter aggregatus]